MINKDTRLFGSFSQAPGNRGCAIFNTAFSYHNINAIYKSYYVDTIAEAVTAAKTLNFSGFAVSMPFKKDVLNCVDELGPTAGLCKSANTVVNCGGKLVAHNTDFLAVKQFLTTELLSNKGNENETLDALVNQRGYEFYVLGNGGFANSVICALGEIGVKSAQITRQTWHNIDKIRSAVVFNCTPVKNISVHKTCFFIDCITSTATGRKLGLMQAAHQYFLYTGLQLPFNYEA